MNKEIYIAALEKFKVIENEYKNELINETVELINNCKFDHSLNSMYENKYGWWEGLTTMNNFNKPLKSFGIYTYNGGRRKKPKVIPAEELTINQIETIINNIKNL